MRGFANEQKYVLNGDGVNTMERVFLRRVLTVIS